ncbi:MAG: hypothetical protein KatS3mg032_1493 [Cyclobacteriaceae bacterium]|nr:MAG: hypothetical protein KatS3mg032_1493 [Cyclobacteriaceae bacterium]
MKVGAQSYRGIDFVRETDLPAAQQEALQKSPDFPERIKILINGKIMDRCIYYKDYEQWFAQVYKKREQPVVRHLPDPAIPLAVSASH